MFLVTFFVYESAEMNCWQEWLIFSDVFFFLMKHGCIDFVDFVDKLVSRLQVGDQHILRTNHVTWLLAQIIRVELVMNALNTDSRKVAFLCSCAIIFSFHINLLPFEYKRFYGCTVQSRFTFSSYIITSFLHLDSHLGLPFDS